MRVRSNRKIWIGLKVLVVAAPLLLATKIAFSSSLNRLSAEFQNAGGEIFTNATAAPSPAPVGAPGGTVVYDKTLNIPSGVAYITFSAQGDTHQIFDANNNPIPGTGSALLMTASLTDAAGNVTVCQPMAGAKLDHPKRQLRHRGSFLLMTLHSGRRSEAPFWAAHERERDCFWLALNIVACRWIHRKKC